MMISELCFGTFSLLALESWKLVMPILKIFQGSCVDGIDATHRYLFLQFLVTASLPEMQT